jgi:GNAT superfamily N-acetyltransferase
MSELLSLERVPGSPPELQDSDIEPFAELYADVFADEPWNEHTVCPVSGVYFGTDTAPGNNCPETGCEDTVLQPAYPLEWTKGYIAEELGRPNAALLLLRDQEQDGRLVGFSWGFSYDSPESFANAKYKTPAMRVAIGGLLRQLDLGTNGLWYLSESGVKDDPRYRGKGISRKFHDQRLAIAQSLGLDAIQRTSANGPMYRTSRRTMEQIMGVETAPDTESKKLLPTGTIVNGLADSEMDGRVLFAKRHQ